MITRFNVRVYFLLLSDDQQSVLLSDEWIGGKAYTKFPGGGLEYGEGIVEALHREAMEELGQSIQLTGHFYTTEDFVPSAFSERDQIISVYYTARLLEAPQFRVSTIPHDFLQREQREESFRWMAIPELTVEEMSFPIDQKVVSLLQEKAV